MKHIGIFLKTLALVTFFVNSVWGAPLSRVVGGVGDQVVTSREVLINQIVERVLSPASRGKRPPPLEEDPGSNEINQVLLEWMIYLEAKTFSLSPLEGVDLKAQERTVLAEVHSGDNSRLGSRFSPTTKELAELLDRKARAKRFVQFKANASKVPVTDAEVLRYFQKNRAKFGDAPFSQFRDNIRAFLVQQQADERIRDWFGVLQKKYKVQRVSSSADKNP